MNTLGMIKQIEDLIRQGYGYTQMLGKLELTEDKISEMIAEQPVLALIIKSRYGVEIQPKPQHIVKQEEPKEDKPLKLKAKSKKE